MANHESPIQAQSPLPTVTMPLLNGQRHAQDQDQTSQWQPASGVNRQHVSLRVSREAWHALSSTLRYSYSNVLLVCVPLGIYAAEHGWSPAAVFTLNFLAMFPLASILTFSTEQLAAEFGSVIGGLINATFGNAVEMIVGISALKEGEISIVQSSMIGSILSSILLILGTSFFCVGVGKQTVDINIDIAGILTSLMIISCSSLIIPSALHIANPGSNDSNHYSNDYILTLSRTTSIILLIFYLLYLFFQSYTHNHLFTEEEDDEQSDKLSTWSSSTVLILATVGVAVCSDYLIDSVDGFVEALGVSRSFIGLIIVPIVGNAGCYVATVQWSRTGKINLAVSVIVGSTLQISLFVTPFLVIVGWIIGKDMSLQFDTFETIALTMSVLIVNCLVRDGQTNYFEGVLLIGTYATIAIAFFVHPDSDTAINLAGSMTNVTNFT
ncbi:hypothetical protein V501_10313 [Pseudogymnoascus sp. VKM F-4519 (FW-2642)]|nr:hypothetical protein V501_10313 [Pseudogymnoascus sp. VKM F-4519 (FW-2642)]